MQSRRLDDTLDAMNDTYLQTRRVELRRLVDGDARLLFALDSDPEVIRYVHQRPPADEREVRATTLSRYMAYYEHFDQLGFWAAIDRESGEFIGWFHLRPFEDRTDDLELGYRLCRSAWGCGLATEVSGALLRKAFGSLGATRVVARALAANAASIRVMQKLGMRFIEPFFESGINAVMYGVSRDEWTGMTRRDSAEGDVVRSDGDGR